jgi:hypothetical protein
LIHPDANISPKITAPSETTSTTTQLEKIYDITTLDNDLDNISKYIEMADTTSGDTFCARILLNSNIELHQFNRDLNLVAWLKSENIQLDRNTLQKTLRPQQIGFFTHMTSRNDQTVLYENRI